MIAEIMIEVFGSALVRVGPEGRSKVTGLPSPEELKERILRCVACVNICAVS